MFYFEGVQGYRPAHTADLKVRTTAGRVYPLHAEAHRSNARFDAGSIAETIGFAFRCLNNFATPEADEDRHVRRFDLGRIAMPLLASGNQRVPVDAMLPRLLEAAVFWLEQGLPIEQLRIVTFSPAETEIATRIFSSVVSARRTAGGSQAAPAAAAVNRDWATDLAGRIAADVIAACRQHLQNDLLAAARPDERSTVEALFARLDAIRPTTNSTASSPSAASGHGRYDVFISYAHKQDEEVQAFVKELQQYRPLLRIFHDRTAIPAGGQWLKMIIEHLGIDRAARIQGRP